MRMAAAPSLSACRKEGARGNAAQACMDVPEREPSACDRNTGLLWRIDSRRGGQWADHPFREGRRMRKVPTRQAALTLVEEGHSYEEAGLRLGVPPGLAYLTATGVPADSSDGLSAGDLD